MLVENSGGSVMRPVRWCEESVMEQQEQHNICLYLLFSGLHRNDNLTDNLKWMMLGIVMSDVGNII